MSRQTFNSERDKASFKLAILIQLPQPAVQPQKHLLRGILGVFQIPAEQAQSGPETWRS